MLKQIVKYAFLKILFLVTVFLYLIYFGQNRFSIMLNQGVKNLPSDLSDIKIESRRGLYCVLTEYNADTKTTCKTSKCNLTNWLKDAKFQVIYISTPEATFVNAYTTFSSLPNSIVKNDTIYSIQFESCNPKTCIVRPLDNEYVSLTFVSDWN